MKMTMMLEMERTGKILGLLKYTIIFLLSDAWEI